LLEDTLAVRGTILYDDFKWETKPGRKLDRRFYAAATYKPFSTTAIRAYFETVDLERRVPSRRFPYDRITPWFEAAELPDSGYTENRPIFQNDLEWQLSETKLPETQQVFTQGASATVYIVDNGIASGPSKLSSWRESVSITLPHRWNHVPSLSQGWFDAFTLLDDKYFPTEKSLRSGSSFQEVNGRVFNLVLNQRITDDLHLELAGHSERVDQFDAEGFYSDPFVQVDANAFLPDGITPNPNVGKLYVESQATYQDIPDSTDQWRAALSYEYDFDENHDGWLTRLGRHRLAGLTSSDHSSHKRQRRFYRIAPMRMANGDLKYPTINGAQWNYNKPEFVWKQQDARLYFRHYLDPTSDRIVPELPFTIGQPLHLIDSAGDPFTVDPENTGLPEEGHRTVLGSTLADSQKWKEDVFQFSYQGYFFDERLVLTYGWRRTLLDTAGLPRKKDPDTGLVPHSDDVDFDPLKPYAEGTTDTKGIVLAPFRGWLDLPVKADLTLFHQQSSTFDRDYGYHDPFGGIYPDSRGEGEDTGVQLSLNGDRFVIRFNHYRVAVDGKNAGPDLNTIQSYLKSIETRVRELDPDLPLLVGSSGIGFNTDLPHPYTYRIMAYIVSTGYELSGRWSISNNLEFRFNAANMDTTLSDIGLEWWDWMDQRLPMYEKLNVPEGGKNNPRDLNGNGMDDRWTWETAPLADDEPVSLAEFWENNVIEGLNGKDIIQSSDGKSNPFIRELRFNVNGMYRFTDGPLRGLNLGGAIRWRESPLLNYCATTIHGKEVYDLNNPLYGDPEWYLDLVARYRFRTSWLGDRAATVSLNVRNALDRDDPIPFLLDTDGNPTRMARVEGIKFILSLKVEL
jgi:hypothetical protein